MWRCISCEAGPTPVIGTLILIGIGVYFAFAIVSIARNHKK